MTSVPERGGPGSGGHHAFCCLVLTPTRLFLLQSYTLPSDFSQACLNPGVNTSFTLHPVALAKSKQVFLSVGQFHQKENKGQCSHMESD